MIHTKEIIRSSKIEYNPLPNIPTMDTNRKKINDWMKEIVSDNMKELQEIMQKDDISIKELERIQEFISTGKLS